VAEARGRRATRSEARRQKLQRGRTQRLSSR
jgi:hypothetical protein